MQLCSAKNGPTLVLPWSEPGAVLDDFENVRRAEEVDALGRRVAERLYETSGHECGNCVRRAVQQRCNLFDVEPRGQLPAQLQKLMLFLVHGSPKTILLSARRVVLTPQPSG